MQWVLFGTHGKLNGLVTSTTTTSRFREQRFIKRSTNFVLFYKEQLQLKLTTKLDWCKTNVVAQIDRVSEGDRLLSTALFLSFVQEMLTFSARRFKTSY